MGGRSVDRCLQSRPPSCVGDQSCRVSVRRLYAGGTGRAPPAVHQPAQARRAACCVPLRWVGCGGHCGEGDAVTHREEVEFGRQIGHDVLTAYRCARNRVWYILGPHIWCTCRKRMHDWIFQDCVMCARGGGAYEHPCTPKCERRMHAGYLLSQYVEIILCKCNARTKGLARIDRPTLRAAASAHMIGGTAAAMPLLQAGQLVGPAVVTMTGCFVADVFAEDFPSNQTRW